MLVLLSGFDAANLLDLRCGANSCAIIVRAVCAALRVDLLLILLVEGEFAWTAEVFLLLRPVVVVLLLLLSPTPMENEGDSAACIDPISR